MSLLHLLISTSIYALTKPASNILVLIVPVTVVEWITLVYKNQEFTGILESNQTNAQIRYLS
jgi:hypothetical protein